MSETERWKQFQSELTEKIRPFLPDPDFEKVEYGDPLSRRIRDTYVSWHKSFPKNNGGTHFLGNAESVSNISPRKFAALAAVNGGDGVTPFGSAETVFYGGDARSLYLELMDGMTQFHDGRRSVSYKLTA